MLQHFLSLPTPICDRHHAVLLQMPQSISLRQGVTLYNAATGLLTAEC